MDFVTVAKIAMELGVIPALALFLVVAMHNQNKRLTDMVAKHDADNLKILETLIREIVEITKHSEGGR